MLFSKHFTILFDSNNEDAKADVLFAVKKKNFKKAVTRNKIKRQMRQMIKKELPVRNIAIIVKSNYNIMQFKSNKDELNNLLSKVD